MSSSVDIGQKEKGILIVGIVPTQGLNGAMLTVEAKYSINFSRLNIKFV